MNQAAIFRQIAANDRNRLLNTLIIKRFDYLFGQAQQIVTFNHLAHHCRTHSARREADDAVHIGDGGDDFFIRDDDAAAGAWQTQLRKAHAQHNVGVPQRARFAKDDAGERYAIGVINHQRDPMLIGQPVKLHQLFVGDHVACRVSRPRHANHPRLFTNMQVFKINVILKLAFR